MTESNSLIADLESLGCMFAEAVSGTVADPEQTVLSALECFWTDKKIFTMTIGLLKFRIHYLINTKRLLSLALKRNLQTQLLLSVVAKKVARASGDSRFAKLAMSLRKRKSQLLVPKKYQDPFYLNRKGIDRDFAIVGARVPDFFEEPVERKQKLTNQILKGHPWLRLRAIAGPEYRADIIYLRLAGKAKNQAEAARILGCHKSSISRVWAAVGDISVLKVESI